MFLSYVSKLTITGFSGFYCRPIKKIIFSSSESTITSTHHQDLTFTLTLERSDSTFNYPEQQWSFISNYAVTDYSGDYKISLIPCTAGPEQKFSDPPKCKFFEPLFFGSLNVSDHRDFWVIDDFENYSDPKPNSGTKSNIDSKLNSDRNPALNQLTISSHHFSRSLTVSAHRDFRSMISSIIYSSSKA